MNITNLKVSYDNINVIKNLNFSIKEEQIISIVGKSGSGKSTLLKAILNNISYEGNIDSKIKEIGYMPQDMALFEFKTVYENIILPLKIKSKKILQKDIDNLLKDFGIYNIKDQKVENISGGQKSRTALIRAIVNQDKLWLLDEPLSKLDYITKYEILNLIKGLKMKYKISIIYVTHDLDEAVNISDNILIFKKDDYQIIENAKEDEKEKINIKEQIINSLKE